jgi:hypothetical protein
MYRSPGATVIYAAHMFFQRGVPNFEARLRRLARTPTSSPEVGICFACHRKAALDVQRKCLRCANQLGKPQPVSSSGQ